MAEIEETKIRLVNGAEVWVSPAQYPRLSEHRWYQFSNGYAYRRTGSRTVMMHREIAGATARDVVLHADGDRLNCRDGNLIVRTRGDVIRERARARPIGGTSRFRGVSRHKRSGRWQVVLRAAGTLHYVGQWDGTPEGEVEAARAYDAAALRLVGKEARLNFPVRLRRRPMPAGVLRMGRSPERTRPGSGPAARLEPNSPDVATLYDKPVQELTSTELERMKAAFLGEHARTRGRQKQRGS